MSVQNDNQNFFMHSVRGLANILAFAVTYLTAIPIFNLTHPFAYAITSRQLGGEYHALSSFVWFVIVALTTFHVSRATLGTLLFMGGLGLALRFLV